MRNLFSKHHLHIICLTLLTTFGFQSAIQAQQQSWFDNKYSMFIHFGIYSQPAGIWKGKEIPNYSEQIQAHGGIYSDVYRDLSLSFNPEKWDATEVVKLAKRNGMRSVVFTTKHHDGFCMYNSAYTKFDIMDATPYKKDVLLTLAEACKAEGLKMGLYFSLIDWTQHPITAQNINNITDQHHRYNLNQIEELLTNYGPISELWFDMGSLSEAQSREMYNLVHRLQPDCMVSGRLGNNCYDFCVMGDNEYPDYTLVRPWQTAASIYTETWSYRSWQQYSEVKAKVEEKIIA
ncbi:MAG: alpha-L-fucosidase, partial [Bacteroidales bacterium]